MLQHYLSVFFFNDTATTEIYTLSLHDALPILPFRIEMSSPDARFFQLYSPAAGGLFVAEPVSHANAALNAPEEQWAELDRKSTRLNSSHANISYAVFCLKKKK